MKKYFLYELKKSLPGFFVITFISILFYILPLATDEVDYYSASNYISYLMVVIGAACVIVPTRTFSYRMQRRSTDLYFALPISRTRLFAIKYIIGFISIFAAFTAAYVLGFIFVTVKFAEDLTLIYYLPLYFASLIPLYIIYSISSFAYTRANSNKDGVMFIIFALFAVLMVTLILSTFVREPVTYTYDDGETYTTAISYIYPWYYMPFTALNSVTTFFQDMIFWNSFEKANLFNKMDIETVNLLISLILFTAISAACTYGMFKTEKDRKAENVNQVSDSIFGYKTMLPLFLLGSCTALGFASLFILDITLYAILFGATYGFAVMYKKTYKIGWKFALVLIAAAIVGIAIGIITNQIFYADLFSILY